MQVLMYDIDREDVDGAALRPFCGKSKAEVIARFGQPDLTKTLDDIQEDLNWDQGDVHYWYVFVIE